MTRSALRLLSFPIFVVAAACGPDPIRPRSLVEPPRAAPADARVEAKPDADDAGTTPAPMKDAGEAAPVDSRSSRPKLPAPDGGDPAPAADADAGTGADAAAAIEAGTDVVSTPVDGGGATVTARAPVLGEILIVEALANPAGQDTGREWIEIASQVDEPLDLAGLHLADASLDVAVPVGIIAAGARLLLGQSADPSVNGGVPVAAAYGPKLVLNNDGEQISICIGPCAVGGIIDHVSWTSAGASYDGRALVFEREANLTCPATEPFGAAGDFGTPGAAGGGCAAPDAGF
jgi:hypothetical protein